MADIIKSSQVIAQVESELTGSQKISQVIAQVEYELEDVYIEDVLWAGAIRTVGTGKEFATLRAAIGDANAAGEASVYLVYNSDATPAAGLEVTTQDCYILGVGDKGYENITVYGIQYSAHKKLYIENIQFLTCFSHFDLGIELKTNKCILNGQISNGYTYYDSATIMDFTNTYFKEGIINGEKLDNISINKCSYDSPLTTTSCIGSFAVNDQAIEGTVNYGPDYGIEGKLIRIAERINYALGLADSFILSESPNLNPTLILDRLSIEPYSPTMIVGQSQQTGAIGYYNFNTTVNLTQLVAWISSNPTVATIDSNGLIVAHSTGITFIRATYGSTSTYIMLKVEQAVTVSTITGSYTYQQIPLTPDPNQTFSCTLLIDGKNIPIDFQLHWNAQANYWVMTLINSASRTYYVDSIPLIAGIQPTINILQPYSYLKIGSCYIVNISGIASDYPTDDNLGTDYIMLWGDTENV